MIAKKKTTIGHQHTFTNAVKAVFAGMIVINAVLVISMLMGISLADALQNVYYPVLLTGMCCVYTSLIMVRYTIYDTHPCCMADYAFTLGYSTLGTTEFMMLMFTRNDFDDQLYTNLFLYMYVGIAIAMCIFYRYSRPKHWDKNGNWIDRG